MGRHSRNKGYGGTIEGTEKQLTLYNVELPFPFIVDVRLDYTEDAVACGIHGSTPIIIPDLYSEKDDIVEFMKAYGYYIKNVRPMILQLTDLCPQCSENGIPRISVRDRNDYRIRTNRDGIPNHILNEREEKQEPKKRPPEHWLCYWHGKGNQHWIQEYQGNIEGTFKPNKEKKIDFRKFFIGEVIKIKTNK